MSDATDRSFDGSSELAPLKRKGHGRKFRTWRNLPRYIAMIWRSGRTMMLLTLLLRLIRAVLPLIILVTGKLIIDEVVHLIQFRMHSLVLVAWLSSGQLRRLQELLAAEFLLAVSFDILRRAVSFVDGLLSDRVSIDASIRLMEHAAALDLKDFEDAAFQNRLDRARMQISGRMTLMTEMFSQAQDVVTAVSVGAGMATFAPWLVVLLAIALVPSLMGEAHFNNLTYALNYVCTPQRRELDYLRQVAACTETAKEVKVFGLTRFLVDRYRLVSKEGFAATRKLAFRRATSGALFTALGTIAYYAAYACIAWRAVSGVITIGDLTFLAAAFLRLRSLTESLFLGFSTISSQALYLDDLFSFLELKPTIRSCAAPFPVPRPIQGGFRFENVGFRYSDAEQWALRHLNLTLGAGEVVALVGENGAGKTTLVKLLARLYDPSEGRIFLDGRDLSEYDSSQLRASVGIIFQDFNLYSMNVADNIAVGLIDARADRPRIERAALASLASDVVQQLPRGFDQMIGKRFANGIDLSGGEWQKIAIARAYMRDAQVLILDEPTAALDARAEYEVFKRFRELSRGKSALLISHRFASVRMADRILVLADGKVESSGTHEQLLAEHGRYAELFDLQASCYR